MHSKLTKKSLQTQNSLKKKLTKKSSSIVGDIDKAHSKEPFKQNRMPIVTINIQNEPIIINSQSLKKINTPKIRIKDELMSYHMHDRQRSSKHGHSEF